MKDAVYWIAATWEEASNDSLRKAWRNLLPDEGGELDVTQTDLSTTESSTTELSNTELSTTDLIETPASLGEETHVAFSEWMEGDIDDPGHQVLDDDEIVAEMLECEDFNDHEGSSDDEAVASSHVTASEAFDALDTTLRWLEQTKADPAHLLLVKKWHDEVARMRNQQASILSYFVS